MQEEWRTLVKVSIWVNINKNTHAPCKIYQCLVVGMPTKHKTTRKQRMSGKGVNT